jgi:arabinofuranosyltransferase
MGKTARQKRTVSRVPWPRASTVPEPRFRLHLFGHSVHLAGLGLVLMAMLWVIVVAVACFRGGEAIASDDAFISFQYARNLARGQGLIFNLGERVWGFTSPLQTLNLGLLTLLGADTVRAAFLTGFIWAALAALLLYALALPLLSRPLALGLAAFFLLDSGQYGSYTLESALLMAVQLGFLLAVTKERARLACVLGALACLVRPDSLLLVAPILLAGQQTRRLRNLAWFVAIGVLWELFAIGYYGTWIPNSYHAKAGLARFGPYLKNAVEVVTGLRPSQVFGFGEPSTAWRVMIALLAFAPLANPEVRRRPVLLYSMVVYPWVLILAYSMVGSYVGHNWEFHSARFLLRISALVGLLGLAGMAAARLRLPVQLRLAGGSILIALVLVNGAICIAEQVREFRIKDTGYYGGARYSTYRLMAEWANRNIPKGSTVAMSEVGTFAYYTDLKLIDVSGIVTRGYIPSERMNHVAFVRRYRPAFAVFYGNRQDMVFGPSLRYGRVAYFPAQGFSDFTVLQRKSVD